MTFLTPHIQQTDPVLAAAITNELQRQQTHIELIASENIASPAVMEAQGSVFTNKYAEGYPHSRYYGGCAFVDVAEDLAIERAKQLFSCNFANVQPHSGSQANQAVYTAVLKPGDVILGMALSAGGHLTHGAKVSQSGKWFNAHHYGLLPDSETIDYTQVEKLALELKPKMLVAGASAYPRVIDFERLGAIAKKVNAYFLADIAHIAGLVAVGLHPHPFPHADFVTTTTHKTLRGPRGGMVLTNNEELAKKIDSAVFPGIQGGPLMHVVAGKAVAFAEALQPAYKTYITHVVNNCGALAEALQQQGVRLVTGGTDNHLVLLDLRSLGVSGADAEKALERAHLTCNKNAIPNDPAPVKVTSGIRLGTAAGTTRGFNEADFRQIAAWVVTVLQGFAKHGESGNHATEQAVRQQVLALCAKHPIYS